MKDWATLTALFIIYVITLMLFYFIHYITANIIISLFIGIIAISFIWVFVFFPETEGLFVFVYALIGVLLFFLTNIETTVGVLAGISLLTLGMMIVKYG